MERRSKSKVPIKQNKQQEKGRSASKKTKNQEVKMQQEMNLNKRQKSFKENILISLANVFLETQNDPSLIYPWMKDFQQLQQKMIGRNYIILGPAQSGKYSAVKYALYENQKDIREILVDCDIQTTEYQFYEKLLDQFVLKCPQCKWPDQRQLNQVFKTENIEFEKLNPYIKRGGIKFVIVVKNSERLFGFKTQSILYNMFEWMKSPKISQRGGLVLISRQLRLTDRLQKRVKSRFCGNRLCIFRPQDPQVYIKIISKRIEAIIREKQTQVWLKEMKIVKADKFQDIFSEEMSDEDGYIKGKKKSKESIKQNTQISFEEILKKNEDLPIFKQLDQYFKSLSNFLTNDEIRQFGISDYFIERVYELQKLKNKNKLKQVFTEESALKPEEQIQCLKKLKEAFESNKQLIEYLKAIMKNQVITIPFVLMVMQNIFIRLDQMMIKKLSLPKLRKLVYKSFQKCVEFQFPTSDIEIQSVQNLNDLEVMLLALIYKRIVINQEHVRLRDIYEKQKGKFTAFIFTKTEAESFKQPPKPLIQHCLWRLCRNKIIFYEQYNTWNSQIKLVYNITKVKNGLQNVAQKRYLTSIIKEIMEEAEINIRLLIYQ